MTHQVWWAFICVTWPTWYLWHDSSISVTWHIHMCDISHDTSSLMGIHMCDMTHLIFVTWLIYKCDMTHSYVWHKSWQIKSDGLLTHPLTKTLLICACCSGISMRVAMGYICVLQWDLHVAVVWWAFNTPFDTLLICACCSGIYMHVAVGHRPLTHPLKHS